MFNYTRILISRRHGVETCQNSDELENGSPGKFITQLGE